MIILQITQLKNFMNTLLRLETFDRFPVSEASITTFTTFSIDGSLHTDFFDPDDAQLLKEKGRTRLLWKDVKSFCYSVIKGKRTPLQFKFVFQLPQAACEKMIADHALPLEIENVFGCFLNFQYKDGKLLLTTGTSLKIFTMDKSLDRVFDEEVRQFLLKNLERIPKDQAIEGGPVFRWLLNLATIERCYSELTDAPQGEGPFEGPVLFIKGADSAYLQSKHKEIILQLFPNASVKVIEGTGHWLHAEKPDTFATLCVDFLATDD